MKNIITSLLAVFLLTVLLPSCEEDTQFYSFPETLSQDQDFIKYVKADQEIANKIISKEIDFPENFNLKVKDASNFKNLDEFTNQYDSPDFIGFSTYKRLSLLKIQSMTTVINKYPELKEMGRTELQKTFSEASSIIH